MMDNQFLLNAHALSQSSIEDLKAMLITYPYCSLFRVNALLKAKELKHPLEKDWLETASIYTPDRAYLFELYRAGVVNLPRETPLIARAKLKAISQRFLSEKETQNTPLPKTSFASWNTPKPKYLDIVEPPRPAKPEEVQSKETPSKIEEVTKETSGEEQAAHYAAKSVAQDDEIISETLAAVFAKQGKKQHAIDIYLKLSLKFPEKKAYFADLIDSLSV